MLNDVHGRALDVSLVSVRMSTGQNVAALAEKYFFTLGRGRPETGQSETFLHKVAFWEVEEGVKRVHFEIRNFSYISLGECLLPVRKMCNHTSAEEKSKKSLRHQDEDGLVKCAAHLLREKFLLDFQPHRGGQVNVCSFF